MEKSKQLNYYWKYKDETNGKKYFPEKNAIILEAYFIKWVHKKGAEAFEFEFNDEKYKVDFVEKIMKNIKTEEKFKISRQCQLFSSLGIVLIVCRNKEGKYLAVNEFKHQGWWLPGGKLKPPETFEKGAVRETKEEGGIDIAIKGILRFEYQHFLSNSQRIRIIYYAEPVDENQKPKDFSDKHSKVSEARFVSLQDLLKLQSSPDGWRGNELYEWGYYIENGGQIYPLQSMAIEGSYVPEVNKLNEEEKSYELIFFYEFIESN